jgi:hypothetical protein
LGDGGCRGKDVRFRKQQGTLKEVRFFIADRKIRLYPSGEATVVIQVPLVL